MFRSRGVKTIPNKKVDVVVVAARYKNVGGENQLDFAQIYEHRGPIWSDIKLYDRERLIEALREGKRIWSGAVADSVLSFNVNHKLVLIEENEAQAPQLSFESADDELPAGEGDDLGVPFL